MTGPACPTLPGAVVERMLSAVLPSATLASAEVLFPAGLADTAHALVEGLARRGVLARVTLTREDAFARLPVGEAAARWVPAPGPDKPDLLVLYGAQPWSPSFDGDWQVELAAMQNRERLRAVGARLLFVEWPRGARRDAEIDLRPAAVGELFARSLDIDYDEMRAWNRALGEQLAGADRVTIRCPLGTRLSLSVAGRPFTLEDCLLGALEPAVYLPGGEIYAPAREDSAHGTVAFCSRGELRIARFGDGLLLAVDHPDGRPDPALADEMAAGVEPLCEFGVGTNAWAPPWQIGTIYEKSAGTVHVAVGGNAHFGGARDSPRHVDLVIRQPEVQVDGRPLTLPRADWKTHLPTRTSGRAS